MRRPFGRKQNQSVLISGAEDAQNCGAHLTSTAAVLSLHPLTSAEPCAPQGVLEPGAEEELQLTVWISGGSEGTAQLVAGTQVGRLAFG